MEKDGGFSVETFELRGVPEIRPLGVSTRLLELKSEYIQLGHLKDDDTSTDDEEASANGKMNIVSQQTVPATRTARPS